MDCYDCANDTNHTDVLIQARTLADGTVYWIGANPSLESRQEVRDNPPGLDEERHTCGAYGCYIELGGHADQCLEIVDSIHAAREWLADIDDRTDVPQEG